MVVAGLLLYAASLEINHAHDHCAVRVEGQILEPPSATECAHRIVDRVCDNAEAADLSGSSERCAKREQKERTGMADSLMILVDRKLAEQRRRHRVGFVALSTAMTHIAAQESLNGKNVDWLEKVSDVQYRR